MMEKICEDADHTWMEDSYPVGDRLIVVNECMKCKVREVLRTEALAKPEWPFRLTPREAMSRREEI